MKKTIKITDLEAIVKQAHEKVKNLKGGKNADYIPFLAKIDPNLFGIAVCLPTGEVIEAGDTTYVFGIESISKVHTAVLILKQYGAEAVLKKIGADATGLPFNSIMAILLEKDHPSNVEFPGYFKGAVFQGAMTGSDAFFFPSYEETEGIVVLEALASHQHTVLRDIPVYNGWIDETSSELCHNVDEFVDSLNKVLNGQVDKREAGYKVAESRSIDLVAYQLVEAYQTVLEM